MRHTLLTILMLAISSTILAQKRDSVTLSGRLFTTEDEQFSEKIPTKKGVIDIYPMKNSRIIEELNYDGLEELRTKRCFTKEDGSFCITLPTSEQFYVRLYEAESDIAERYIYTNKKQIDMGDITLPDMISVNGWITPDTTLLEDYSSGEDYNNSHIEIVCSRWVEIGYLDKRLEYPKDFIVKSDSTYSENHFKLKLRRGEYILKIYGCGVISKSVIVESEPLELGEIKLGPLIITTDDSGMRKKLNRRMLNE